MKPLYSLLVVIALAGLFHSGCTSKKEAAELATVTKQLQSDMEKYITEKGFPNKVINPFREGVFQNLPITCSPSECSDQKHTYSGFCSATACSLTIIPQGDLSQAHYVIHMSIGDIPQGRYRLSETTNSQPTEIRWKQLCLYKHLWDTNLCKHIGYPSSQMSLEQLQMLGIVR